MTSVNCHLPSSPTKQSCMACILQIGSNASSHTKTARIEDLFSLMSLSFAAVQKFLMGIAHFEQMLVYTTNYLKGRLHRTLLPLTVNE